MTTEKTEPEPATDGPPILLGPITLDWTETIRYKITLTPDEARKAFGLGGTSDNDLHLAITAMAANFPAKLSALRDAVRVSCYDQRLKLLDGIDPSEF